MRRLALAGPSRIAQVSPRPRLCRPCPLCHPARPLHAPARAPSQAPRPPAPPRQSTRTDAAPHPAPDAAPRPAPRRRALTVLALESSADDSCAAIVDADRRIHANVVLKQHELNAAHGGIHPVVAHEAHLANVCLAAASLTLADIDAVAYTRGPGMYGPLSVGATAARAIAAATGKPLVGVHHMQAHALTPLLTERDPPRFPFLSLLVSGGHTLLVLSRAPDEFEVLATTLDSAMGDAFDKFARALGLAHDPARGLGAALEDRAARAPLPPYAAAPLAPLPVPLSANDGAARLAFSFAGLLAAAERRLVEVRTAGARGDARGGAGGAGAGGAGADGDGERAIGVQPGEASDVPEPARRELARVFQAAAVAHVVRKTEAVLDLVERGRAGVESGAGSAGAGAGTAAGTATDTGTGTAAGGAPARPTPVAALVVSGGVGSNLALRQALADMLDRRQTGARLCFPPVELCTDNAAMIAWAAIVRLGAGLRGEPADLPLRKHWPLGALYDDVPADCYGPGAASPDVETETDP